MANNGVFIFILVFLLICVIFGIYLMTLGIKPIVEFRKSINWHKINADLIDCNYSPSEGKYGPHYWTEIKYEYIVGNYKFKGDKIAFGYDKSQAKDFHKDLHEKLESKKQVTIWYDPLNIENSVLIKKISSPCISSFAFHCIFFLFPVIIFSMIGLGVFFEESYKDDIILTMFFLMGILFITAFIFGNISNIKMNRVIIEEIEKM